MRASGGRALALAALGLLAGCGGAALPSRAQVEREVARQARSAVSDSHGQKITPIARCVEGTTSARAYACTVALKIGSGKYYVTSRPEHVRAVVSKDGKRIVVSGL